MLHRTRQRSPVHFFHQIELVILNSRILLVQFVHQYFSAKNRLLTIEISVWNIALAIRVPNYLLLRVRPYTTAYFRNYYMD